MRTAGKDLQPSMAAPWLLYFPQPTRTPLPPPSKCPALGCGGSMGPDGFSQDGQCLRLPEEAPWGLAQAQPCSCGRGWSRLGEGHGQSVPCAGAQPCACPTTLLQGLRLSPHSQPAQPHIPQVEALSESGQGPTQGVSGLGCSLGHTGVSPTTHPPLSGHRPSPLLGLCASLRSHLSQGSLLPFR